MAEITKQRQGELVRAAFEFLRDHLDGMPAREVIAHVERSVGLTPFEQSFYPSNPNLRRFEKIVRFSTISSVKAGWLVKDKGRWILTDAGRAALDQYRSPEAFMREAVRLYREWRRDQPDREEEDELDSETPGPATTLEEAEESAWAEIEAHLSRLNPYDFQNLVAGLLRGMAYHVSWVAPAGPDKGVDIIAHKDPLGVERDRIKVQVKRRADKISVVEVRSFLAVLGENDVGLFVTTAGFTADAEAEARTQERRRIMLLDGKRLFDLWVEHYDQVPKDQQSLLPLRQVHFLAPSD
jgi:restriction system protein